MSATPVTLGLKWEKRIQAGSSIVGCVLALLVLSSLARDFPVALTYKELGSWLLRNNFFPWFGVLCALGLAGRWILFLRKQKSANEEDTRTLKDLYLTSHREDLWRMPLTTFLVAIAIALGVLAPVLPIVFIVCLLSL